MYHHESNCCVKKHKAALNYLFIASVCMNQFHKIFIRIFFYLISEFLLIYMLVIFELFFFPVFINQSVVIT